MSKFDAIRPFANDAIKFELEGPAEIIGDNPFALVGGTGAIWIRAKEQTGTARLTYPSGSTASILVKLLDGQNRATDAARAAIASTWARASSSSRTPMRSRSATTRRWTRSSAPTI